MSIYSVKLYKLNNIQWVFDDPNKGIVAEALVAGADLMIDKIIGGYDEDLAYTLQFSTKDYPGSKMITLVQGQDARNDKRIPQWTETGSWWECKEDDHVMWLCDTLDEYIEIEDEVIFFSINIGKKGMVADYELCI